MPAVLAPCLSGGRRQACVDFSSRYRQTDRRLDRQVRLLCEASPWGIPNGRTDVATQTIWEMAELSARSVQMPADVLVCTGAEVAGLQKGGGRCHRGGHPLRVRARQHLAVPGDAGARTDRQIAGRGHHTCPRTPDRQSNMAALHFGRPQPSRRPCPAARARRRLDASGDTDPRGAGAMKVAEPLRVRRQPPRAPPAMQWKGCSSRQQGTCTGASTGSC
jgi:hypothetical protein